MDPLTAGILAAGGILASLFGRKKKIVQETKTTTPSNTDPYYAMMSPYILGQLMDNLKSFQGFGMPQGMLQTNMFGPQMYNDIWGNIQKMWPSLLAKAGGKTAGRVTAGNLPLATGRAQGPVTPGMLGGGYPLA